jgi:hypothetical protein
MFEIMRGVGTSIKESSGSCSALVGELGQLVSLLGAGGAGVPAVAPTPAQPVADCTRSSAERTQTPDNVHEVEDD